MIVKHIPIPEPVSYLGRSKLDKCSMVIRPERFNQRWPRSTCERVARYEVDGVKYCKQHSGKSVAQLNSTTLQRCYNMKYLLILLTLATQTVTAEGLRLGMFIASDHHDNSFKYNEDHRDSFYACYDQWCGGYYENSYSETTRSPDKKTFSEWLAYQHEIGRFSVSIGLVHGYQGLSTDENIIPFAAFTIKIGVVKWWQFGTISTLGLETPTGLFE